MRYASGKNICSATVDNWVIEQPGWTGIVFMPFEFFADADRTIFDAKGLQNCPGT